MELITAIRDISLAGAAIVTAGVAVFGLRKWRIEIRGKADFEVARSLIRATYKLRGALNVARSPLIVAAEFPAGYSLASASKNATKNAEAWIFVYENRFKPVYASVQEFDAQALEAEALWGAEIKSKTDALEQCARNLHVSMQTSVENEASSGLDFKTNPDFAKSVRADVSVGTRDNPLSTKITESVSAIEELVRPRLTRK